MSRRPRDSLEAHIKVLCDECETIRTDPAPIYDAETGAYIVRRLLCDSIECSAAGRARCVHVPLENILCRGFNDATDGAHGQKCATFIKEEEGSTFIKEEEGLELDPNASASGNARFPPPNLQQARFGFAAGIEPLRSNAESFDNVGTSGETWSSAATRNVTKSATANGAYTASDHASSDVSTPSAVNKVPVIPNLYSEAVPVNGAPSQTNQSYSIHGCDGCRRKKTVCDRARPSCTYCRKLGLPCAYNGASTKPVSFTDDAGTAESLCARIKSLPRRKDNGLPLRADLQNDPVLKDHFNYNGILRVYSPLKKYAGDDSLLPAKWWAYLCNSDRSAWMKMPDPGFVEGGERQRSNPPDSDADFGQQAAPTTSLSRRKREASSAAGHDAPPKRTKTTESGYRGRRLGDDWLPHQSLFVLELLDPGSSTAALSGPEITAKVNERFPTSNRTWPGIRHHTKKIRESGLTVEKLRAAIAQAHEQWARLPAQDFGESAAAGVSAEGMEVDDESQPSTQHQHDLPVDDPTASTTTAAIADGFKQMQLSEGAAHREQVVLRMPEQQRRADRDHHQKREVVMSKLRVGRKSIVYYPEDDDSLGNTNQSRHQNDDRIENDSDEDIFLPVASESEEDDFLSDWSAEQDDSFADASGPKKNDSLSDASGSAQVSTIGIKGASDRRKGYHPRDAVPWARGPEDDNAHETSVQVRCGKCQHVMEDPEPRFERSTGVYVVRQMACTNCAELAGLLAGPKRTFRAIDGRAQQHYSYLSRKNKEQDAPSRAHAGNVESQQGEYGAVDQHERYTSIWDTERIPPAIKLEDEDESWASPIDNLIDESTLYKLTLATDTAREIEQCKVTSWTDLGALQRSYKLETYFEQLLSPANPPAKRMQLAVNMVPLFVVENEMPQAFQEFVNTYCPYWPDKLWDEELTHRAITNRLATMRANTLNSVHETNRNKPQAEQVDITDVQKDYQTLSCQPCEGCIQAKTKCTRDLPRCERCEQRQDSCIYPKQNQMTRAFGISKADAIAARAAKARDPETADENSVTLACKSCKKHFVDSKPRYAKATDKYLVQTKRCPHCGQRQLHHPADGRATLSYGKLK